MAGAAGTGSRNAGQVQHRDRAHAASRSSRPARAPVQRRTAAIGAYSHPVPRPRTVSRRPSPAPVSSTAGMSKPARLSVAAAPWLAWVSPLSCAEQFLAAAAARSRARSAPRRPAAGETGGAGAGHRDGHRRVAGEVVRAGEAGLRRSAPAPNGGSCFRSLIADRGGRASTSARDRLASIAADESRALAYRRVVLLAGDGRTIVEQGPGALGVLAPVPAPVHRRRLRGDDDGKRVLPPRQLLQPAGAVISRSRQPAAASTASAPVTARCTCGVTDGSVSWAASTPTVNLPSPQAAVPARQIRQGRQQVRGTGRRGGERAHMVAGR